MLDTPTITRIKADNPAVYAFEIRGGTRAEDVEAMAQLMNAAFDQPGKVSMLLLMRDVDMGDALASVNAASLKAQARSPGNVDKYVVIGAPAAAEAMIRTMAPLLPIEARVFRPEAEPDAWAFVAARPV